MADCKKILEHNILGPPVLEEQNIQKRLLGLIIIPGKNIMSIDNKLGFNVCKVPISDIIICRLNDYRRGKPTIKDLSILSMSRNIIKLYIYSIPFYNTNNI